MKSWAFSTWRRNRPSPSGPPGARSTFSASWATRSAWPSKTPGSTRRRGAREHRYRRIFEGSKDTIFVTDREGKMLDLNPAGVELLKFSSKGEALALAHVREIFHDPRDWERFQTQGGGGGFHPGSGADPEHPGRRPGAHPAHRHRAPEPGRAHHAATKASLRILPNANGANGSCCGRRRPPKASWRACRCPPSSSTGTTASFIGTRPARS